MSAAATTPVTVLSARSQSPVAKSGGLSPAVSTPLCLFSLKCSSGSAAHLALWDRPSVTPWILTRLWWKWKVLEPTSLCARGRWTARCCPQQGDKSHMSPKVLVEGTLLKGGGSSIQQWLQPGDRGDENG